MCSEMPPDAAVSQSSRNIRELKSGHRPHRAEQFDMFSVSQTDEIGSYEALAACRDTGVCSLNGESPRHRWMNADLLAP
jgi:hypothetical protein